MSHISLSNLEIHKITFLYNQIADRAVNKFRDKSTAVKRLEDELIDRGMEIYTREDGDLGVRVSSSEVDELEDNEPSSVTEDLMVELNQHPDIIQPATTVAPTDLEQELEIRQEAPAAEPAPKKARKVAEPRVSKLPRVMGKTIHVITKEGKNPKRAGSSAWQRFNLYIENPGITSEAYEKLVFEQKLGDRRDVLRDLSWDSSHLFIRLD